MKPGLLVLTYLYVVLFVSRSYAQNSEMPAPFYSSNLGIGGGIDYGGIGLRYSYLPDKHVSIFIAGGYNFFEFAYNTGMCYRIAPETKISPYIGIMYGYNGVIMIENAEWYNKTYYGASITFGIEPFRRRSRNFWNFELIIPIISQQFQDDWNDIKANPGIVIKNDLMPVLFSIGYHIGL